MRMRVLMMLGGVIWLAACGPAGQSAVQTGVGLEMPCALAFATHFSDTCGYDQVRDIMTVHHPDGGFRRLRVLPDGPGVAAADGAFPAILTKRKDGWIEARIEGDSYLLPTSLQTPNKKPARP